MLQKIQTHIINLEKRVDRKNHILNEFDNKFDFEIILTNAIEDFYPALGLYKSLYNVVSKAKKQNLPYVLFCEDDHEFTANYDKDNFKRNILLAESLSADLLLGGVIWFDYGVKSSPELLWINHFTGTQFSIIYSKFYDTILNTEFKSTDVIDEWMARLSDKKYLINPMISIQKYFGYSDVTDNNSKEGLVDNMILETANRLDTLVQISKHVTKIKKCNYDLSINVDNLQIATYLIATNAKTDIRAQYKDRTEFSLEEIKKLNLAIDEIELFDVIKESVRMAISRNEEVIVICKDTHIFAQDYNRGVFFKNLINASILGADIISGGNKSVNQIVVVDENLCWFDFMESFEFLVIYEKFYNQILDISLSGNESVGFKLSSMTANKYLFYPFISRFHKLATPEYIDTRNYYKIKNQKYNICCRVMDTIYENAMI